MPRIDIPADLRLRAVFFRAGGVENQMAALRRRCHILPLEPHGDVYIDLVRDIYFFAACLSADEDAWFDFCYVVAGITQNPPKINEQSNALWHVLGHLMPADPRRPARLSQLRGALVGLFSKHYPFGCLAAHIEASGGIRAMASSVRKRQLHSKKTIDKPDYFLGD